MNVYSIDVKITGTAYIKAESLDEAKCIFEENYKEGFGGELPTSDRSGSMESVEVSGRQYEDPALPDCSLSPAITFYGAAADGGEVELDLAAEDVETDDEEEE